MAKPPTSVRSIRLPVSEWERLEGEAKILGMTVNALVAANLARPTRGIYEIDAKPRPASQPTKAELQLKAALSAPRLQPLDVGDAFTVADEPAQTVVAVSVPLIQRKAFNPQPKKGTKK